MSLPILNLADIAFCSYVFIFVFICSLFWKICSLFGQILITCYKFSRAWMRMWFFLNMQFSTSFDITWYVEAAIYRFTFFWSVFFMRWSIISLHSCNKSHSNIYLEFFLCQKNVNKASLYITDQSLIEINHGN